MEIDDICLCLYSAKQIRLVLDNYLKNKRMPYYDLELSMTNLDSIINKLQYEKEKIENKEN